MIFYISKIKKKNLFLPWIFFFLRVIATFNFTILTFFFMVYDSKFLRKSSKRFIVWLHARNSLPYKCVRAGVIYVSSVYNNGTLDSRAAH